MRSVEAAEGCVDAFRCEFEWFQSSDDSLHDLESAML